MMSVQMIRTFETIKVKQIVSRTCNILYCKIRYSKQYRNFYILITEQSIQISLIHDSWSHNTEEWITFALHYFSRSGFYLKQTMLPFRRHASLNVCMIKSLAHDTKFFLQFHLHIKIFTNLQAIISKKYFKRINNIFDKTYFVYISYIFHE